MIALIEAVIAAAVRHAVHARGARIAPRPGVVLDAGPDGICRWVPREARS